MRIPRRQSIGSGRALDVMFLNAGRSLTGVRVPRNTLRKSRNTAIVVIPRRGTGSSILGRRTQSRGGPPGAHPPPAPPSVALEVVPVPLTRLVLGTMSFGDTADE